jgi:hypothetical protein
MINKEFIVSKVREQFCQMISLELAEKILQEVFGVGPHYWGFEKDLASKRPYAKHVEIIDEPSEEVFIGEKDGKKYYIKGIEYIVCQIDPGKFYYSDWKGFRTFDKCSEEKIVFEFYRDIEKYGSYWRLTIRVVLGEIDEFDEFNEIDIEKE